MLTKNNWLQSNIKDRLIDNSVNLQLSISLYSFYDMSFDEATNYTCDEIYKEHKKLYLALSGGLDSEYVLRAFHRNNIPIQPIIVCCGNEKENEYAHTVCNELNITPIVLDVSERSFLEYFLQYIYKNGGIGYNSTQRVFAHEYAYKNDGILITGENFLGDANQIINDYEYAFINEWDFYEELSFNQNYINFFLYTAELAYAIAPKDYMKWNEYKSLIYNINKRNKFKAVYSSELSLILQNLCKPNYNKTSIIWTKQKFFDTFEKYKGDTYDKTINHSYKR